MTTNHATSRIPLLKPLMDTCAVSINEQKTWTQAGSDVLNLLGGNMFFGPEFFKGMWEDRWGRNGIMILILKEQQRLKTMHIVVYNLQVLIVKC